ncbi:uncharacterized protein BXZ73DRAFT_19005, partial [Epithele typhae]|uniref:uncharacterized protein n=1 Tax=Epithele typhae TaxID=378194 RepID=UPI00200769A9
VPVVACQGVRGWTNGDVSSSTGAHHTEHRVDEDAKAMADLPTVANDRSLVHAKHLPAVQLKSDGAKQYREQSAYAGKHFLRLRLFDSPKYTAKAALEAHGHSKTRMARFCCRVVLNHEP